jgi:hypothetical protein
MSRYVDLSNKRSLVQAELRTNRSKVAVPLLSPRASLRTAGSCRRAVSQAQGRRQNGVFANDSRDPRREDDCQSWQKC